MRQANRGAVRSNVSFELVMQHPADERINVLAPIVRGRKGEFKKELAALRSRGFTRVRVDGQLRSLDEDISLDRRRNHAIEVVVDRLVGASGCRAPAHHTPSPSPSGWPRTWSSFNQPGVWRPPVLEPPGLRDCGISVPEMTPRAFSFNSPPGACPGARGSGGLRLRPARVVPDDQRPWPRGAIAPWGRGHEAFVSRARPARRGLRHCRRRAVRSDCQRSTATS